MVVEVVGFTTCSLNCSTFPREYFLSASGNEGGGVLATCVVEHEPRKYVSVHADHMTPVRQHEIDHEYIKKTIDTPIFSFSHRQGGGKGVYSISCMAVGV